MNDIHSCGGEHACAWRARSSPRSKASSIQVAEAAKVIENTQRDLNIAFVNELAIIFHRLGLDTSEVLEVAGTKRNFLPFRPGLVGEHCIPFDPFHLTRKARAGWAEGPPYEM